MMYYFLFIFFSFTHLLYYCLSIREFPTSIFIAKKKQTRLTDGLFLRVIFDRCNGLYSYFYFFPSPEKVTKRSRLTKLFLNLLTEV